MKIILTVALVVGLFAAGAFVLVDACATRVDAFIAATSAGR